MAKLHKFGVWFHLEIRLVEKRKNMIQMKFHCNFCGFDFTRKFDGADSAEKEKEVMKVSACERCFVYPEKKGDKVKFGSPERTPERDYLKSHLTLGEVYTVSKIQQHQHGRTYELLEVPNRTCNGMAFVPVGFDLRLSHLLIRQAREGIRCYCSHLKHQHKKETLTEDGIRSACELCECGDLMPLPVDFFKCPRVDCNHRLFVDIHTENEFYCDNCDSHYIFDGTENFNEK